MIDWKRVLGFGGAGFAASALLWFALRAYTGIFEILNLRVFVGIVALLPALLLPVWGFDPKLLTRDGDAVVPKAVSAASALCAAAAIVSADLAAGAAWSKFNLICLAVSVVLPFQLESVLRKK